MGEGLRGLTLVGSSYITISAVMATTCTLGNRWHWPRQLGCCPRIFVQGLVLFPPWSLAHCSHGDQLSDGAQLVSGYEYSHVTHIQVVISVLLAPDLSWCEVAWVPAPEHCLAVDKLPSFGDCICCTTARPPWAWAVGFFNFNFDCDKCLG